jgi:sugar/nucleoside kinase (ribokinase family)
LPALLDRLKGEGKTLSLDTNDDPADEWAGILREILDRVDLLLPNEDEVLRMTKTSSVEAALDELQGRVPVVVVKCGPRGALVQTKGVREWIAPQRVEAVDTVGAGDSFDSGFLHAWLRGASVKDAAAFGNLTGALSVLRPGGVEAFRDSKLRREFLEPSPWVSP